MIVLRLLSGLNNLSYKTKKSPTSVGLFTFRYMQKMTNIYPSRLHSKHYELTNDGTNVLLFRHQHSQLFGVDYREHIMYDYDEVLKLYEDSIPPFRGDALVVGLGYGLLSHNYRAQCDSFLYLDNNTEIIEMISPYITDCEIEYADAYEYDTLRKFDCIFLDIYNRPVDNHLEKLAQLIDRFSTFLKPGGVLTHLKIQLD